MKVFACVCLLSVTLFTSAHAQQPNDPIFKMKLMHMIEDMGLLASAYKACGSDDAARDTERLAEQIIAAVARKKPLMGMTLYMELGDGLAYGLEANRPCSLTRIEELFARIDPVLVALPAQIDAMK